MKCSRVPSLRWSMPAHRPVAPAERAALTTASRRSGRSDRPGMIGAIPTPTSIPDATSFLDRPQSLSGMRGARLGAAPDFFIDGWDADGDVQVGAARQLTQNVKVADDHRTASDHRRGVGEVAQRDQALAAQLVPALGRLIGIGGRADDDRLLPPGLARELAPQHAGHVDLDSNRTAVTIV